MRNISALHQGFAGCGATLSAVRRQFGLRPGQAAETLDALGTLLMVTGQACLPDRHEADTQTISQQAESWSLISSDVQLETLERLMGFLAEPPPTRKHDPGEIQDHPMLPAEMGAWDSDISLPSCLGMLIILAAYAHLTTAPFLVGSVQRMSAEPATLGLEGLLSSVYKWASDRLPAAFNQDGLPTKLEGIMDDAREAMDLMARRQLFHGALVIRLSDGRWASLDPYMHNLSFFEPETRPLDRIYGHLIQNPTAASSVQGRGYWEHLPSLERQLHEVYGVIEYLLGLPRDVPLMELADRLRHLAHVHAGITMTSIELMLRFACSEPPYQESRSLQGSRMVLANLSTDRFHNEVRQRLLMVLLNVWAEEANNIADHTRTSEPHHAMMLSSPARTLGVWTAINLRHRAGARVAAADLLEYSSGDVVLYNALIDQLNRRTNSDENALINRLVARLRQAPDRLVHPLLIQALA